MPSSQKPKLLIVSGVSPSRGRSGQEQRVNYTLRETRKTFEVTFLTVASRGEYDDKDLAGMSSLADEVILWQGPYSCGIPRRIWNGVSGRAYSAVTGLKRSNYELGRLQFSPARMDALLGSRTFDCVLFEYWHAADAAAAFRARGIPCVLDMHDVLWKSYELQLARMRLPRCYREFRLNQYRRREERAWSQFDAVIAINREEMDYVRSRAADAKLFHTPMGIDMDRWPYCWQPTDQPPRVAYYGSLAGAHHREPVMRCYERIMPEIWKRKPGTELWLVGNNPPEGMRALTRDPRVKVTGFVENVAEVLGSMTAVLCPWTGEYGFRSRAIETMAVGTPMIATPDAVYGMDLDAGRGLLLGRSDDELAEHALRLIENPAEAGRQSLLARQQVESRFSAEATYERLVKDMRQWLDARTAVVQ